MGENFLGAIREKTEEADLSTVLKTSFGGYTKRSVQEYLAYLRAQQASLKESYTRELERMTAERNSLEEELNAQKEYTETAIAEVKAGNASVENDLEEAIDRIHKNEEELRKNQEELNRYQEELAERDRLIEELKDAADQAAAALAIRNKELESCTRKLESEKLRAEESAAENSTERLRTRAAQEKTLEQEKTIVDQAFMIEQLKTEMNEYRESHSDEVLKELENRISGLVEDVKALHGEVELRDRELENRAAKISRLNDKEKENNRAMEVLQSELAKSRDLNELTEGTNNELGNKLTAQINETIELIHENARIKAENAILKRKLGAEA